MTNTDGGKINVRGGHLARFTGLPAIHTLRGCKSREVAPSTAYRMTSLHKRLGRPRVVNHLDVGPCRIKGNKDKVR